MNKIFNILSREHFNDVDFIYEADDEMAFECRLENSAYKSHIVISTESYAKAISEMDYIESPSGLFLVSKNFLRLIEGTYDQVRVNPIKFKLTSGADVLEHTFFQFMPNKAPADYQSVDPVRFFPKVRKFRKFNFVLFPSSDEKIWLGRKKECLSLLCSHEFVNICRQRKLKLRFEELPVLSN